MRTYWFCERCWAKGSVQHDSHAGVWEVYEKLIRAHVKKGQPLGCDTGVSKVRVALTKPKDWR
jgi:hypothetical protein